MGPSVHVHGYVSVHMQIYAIFGSRVTVLKYGRTELHSDTPDLGHVYYQMLSRHLEFRVSHRV